MKRIQFIILFALLTLICQSQVTITSTPELGYEQRIRLYLDTMTVVDTHEHLLNPDLIRSSGMLDFMLLFHHYAADDIKSGGMSKQAFNKLLTDSLTATEKWVLLKPHWENSFNTAYNKVVALTSERLFGINKIDETTVEEISAKIKEAYKSDWQTTVLRDKCKFEYLINSNSSDHSFGDQTLLRYTKIFKYFSIDSKAEIDKISIKENIKITNLDDLVKCISYEFDKALDEGFATIKMGEAYNRILFFQDVTEVEAQEVFSLIMANPEKKYSFEKVKPLSDYMMHRLLDLAKKHNKPMQIHTGLLSGDGNYIENSNPTYLSNLFLTYRDVNFILFHGAYPFGGDLASLAINFRNVYIDLCWLYIISPSYSERYLHEWLETVPVNKIMGFGGDYHNVENVYGHLLFAKEILGNVLIEKVRNRYFSEKEAIKIAGMILHDNAINLFKLNK